MECILCNCSKSESPFFAKAETVQHGEMHICGKCIDKLTELKQKEDGTADVVKNGNLDNIPSTKEIVSYLNRFIISQYEAKKTIAVAIRNHYKRLAMTDKDSDIVEKSNILIMGESGTGKTAMIKNIAEYINVPLVIIDTSVITSDGYIGDSIESAIQTLYKQADGDIELAEKGIVFFDEIDKKKKAPDAGKSKDVSGSNVQTSMLKLVEGKEVKVGKNETLNTEKILFIGGGAFVDLKDIIEKRLKTNKIGFVKDNESKEVKLEEIYKNTTTDDLIEFGMIPELVGRFPVLTYTKSLSENDIMRIMTEPENSIVKQFQKLFKMDEISLHFDPKAVEYVAKKVANNKTGVRGIRKELENVLEDIQYDIEDYKRDGVYKISLTKNKTENHLKPRFRYNK